MPGLLLDKISRRYGTGKSFKGDRGRLFNFFLDTWKVLEPGHPLSSNWHQELICEYVELAYQCKIKRLLINIPPRHLKSTIVTICSPCWEWVENPWKRFLCLSYSGRLSTKHSLKRRTLIQSSWYQTKFSDRFQLSGDLNLKTEFGNNFQGQMFSSSFGGTVTGEGGDVIIIDDPHNPNEIESDKVRESTVEEFDDVAGTRLNDPDNGVIIVVMQRLHERDVSGHILSEIGGYEHLCLPTECERPEVLHFPISGKTIERSPGSYLHSDRFGKERVEEARRTLGAYKFAGRHQQSPAPAEGGMFKYANWGLYTKLPAKFSRVILSVDSSFKDSKDSDFVTVQVIGESNRKIQLEVEGKFKTITESLYYLLYQWRSKAGITDTENAIRDTGHRFPAAFVKLIEDKANGPAIIERLSREITGITPFNPGSDSKTARASSIQPIQEAGRILLPAADYAIPAIQATGREIFTVGEWWELYPPPTRGSSEHIPVESWCKPYVDEFALFPNATNDDQVDGTVQAVIWLESNNSTSAMELLSVFGS